MISSSGLSPAAPDAPDAPDEAGRALFYTFLSCKTMMRPIEKKLYLGCIGSVFYVMHVFALGETQNRLDCSNNFRHDTTSFSLLFPN